jgi:hypothetical protein
MWLGTSFRYPGVIAVTRLLVVGREACARRKTQVNMKNCGHTLLNCRRDCSVKQRGLADFQVASRESVASDGKR